MISKANFDIKYISDNNLNKNPCLLVFFSKTFHKQKKKLKETKKNSILGSCYLKLTTLSLREKCPYSEFFWTEWGKYGPEKLRIWTLFAQWMFQPKSGQCSLLIPPENIQKWKENVGQKWVMSIRSTRVTNGTSLNSFTPEADII